jgi:hypothetical protein
MTGSFWYLGIIKLTLPSSKVGRSINFGYKQIPTSHEYRSILAFRRMKISNMDLNTFKPLQHFIFHLKNTRLTFQALN